MPQNRVGGMLLSLLPGFDSCMQVSYKLAWTSISSLLSQFSRDYGPEVLLQINIAYFFPSIPVLCLQTVFNDGMDRRMGLPLAALTRFTIGLGGLALLMSFFPYLAATHQGLIATTVIIGEGQSLPSSVSWPLLMFTSPPMHRPQGMSYGIAFGTSYQLASKFSPGSTVAVRLPRSEVHP